MEEKKFIGKIRLDRKANLHYPRKWICPSCGKKRYVRYYNFTTHAYLPYPYGRCDREENCSYFLKFHLPDKNLRSKHIILRKKTQSPIQFSTIEPITYEQSLKNYHENTFVRWLIETFGKQQTRFLIKQYKIGTYSPWKGANVFWQIDKNGKVRTGKIMLYKANGHRDKEKNAYWMHSALKLQNYKLLQCFFGEHLLSKSPPNKKICIVESEKTAIVCTHFFPNYIWLASGGSTMLNVAKCSVLANREVIFYPDFSKKARERWHGISREINKKYKIKSFVSSFNIDINDGSDLADYLLNAKMENEYRAILTEM